MDNIDPNLCTDLVYSFAILDGQNYDSIVVQNKEVDIDYRGYVKFNALKTRNPRLKTFIALGGWIDSHDPSDKYYKMATDSVKRASFVASVVRFLQLYGFDGFDVDWEYPSFPAEKVGFAALLRELRQAFGTRYLLSVAVAASKSVIDAGKTLLLA